MQHKYKEFSPIDFLKDECFLKWQLFKEEADNAYWQDLIKNYLELQTAINDAVALYESNVKLNSFKMPQYEIMERLVLLQERISKRKQQRHRRRVVSWVSAAAASVVLCLTFVFNANHPADQPLVSSLVSQDTILKETNEVTLVVDNSAMILSNHSQISYMASGAVIVNADSNTGDPLIREHIAATQQNKLIVPKGRCSSIILADNSRVWLNSGTTLIFPSSFGSEKREIYVDGEIYIEVEKDPIRPFVVKSSKLNIEVIGTKFNVSAYSSDKEHAVVLVEGSIVVTASNTKTLLHPNQLLTITGNGDYNIDEVSVMDYICWRYGWIQAHTTSLSELAKRLSRYYDKEITCAPQVNMLKCSGKLVLFDDLEKVLYTISKNMNIEYRYKDDKTIELYPKK
jgi:ferric-dicitrate binding protein FerR (iron transport regulator)